MGVALITLGGGDKVGANDDLLCRVRTNDCRPSGIAEAVLLPWETVMAPPTCVVTCSLRI